MNKIKSCVSIFYIMMLVLTVGARAFATIELPYIFTDHMVLQRELTAPVWGRAVPGVDVSVSFSGQTLKTSADSNGNWKVEFTGLAANAEGSPLKISSEDEEVIIKDVVVGEVWLAAGQSNLAHPMGKLNGGEAETKSYHDPLMRLHMISLDAADTPQFNSTGLGPRPPGRKSQWYKTEEPYSIYFGGTPYYFAKELRAFLGENVPVGIIQFGIGARSIQCFSSKDAMEKTDLGRRQLATWNQAIENYDSGKAATNYSQALAKWEVSGKNPAIKPANPVNPHTDSLRPTTLFNAMLNPQIPYGFRGCIWYQGENNVPAFEEPWNYAETLHCMIEDWRVKFGRDFTFIIIQLANMREPLAEPSSETRGSTWPLIQDQQRLGYAHTTRTGLVVLNELGETNNIHPHNKLDVGRRLVRWAKKLDYGVDIVPGGPIFKEAVFNGPEVIISFDYAQGLTTRDAKMPGHFDLKGADGKLYWADARIEGEKVIVSAKEVPNPVQVRYAWAQNPAAANLVNSTGLPASCFAAVKQ